MPGFDGTGPMGQGPMTGGARGPCNPANRAAGGVGRAAYTGPGRPYRAASSAGRPRWGLRGFRGRGFRGGRGGAGFGRGHGRGRGRW